MENNIRKLMKKFQRDPMVGSIDMDLLSRYSDRLGGMALTGRYRRVVPIQSNSKENSLLKLVKKFERDPMFGSIVMDLLSRYSGRVDGIASPDAVDVLYQFQATPWKITFGNS